MKYEKDDIRVVAYPFGFLAFLMIAVDLIVEFITGDPIMVTEALENFRWAMLGIIALAFIGLLVILDSRS